AVGIMEGGRMICAGAIDAVGRQGGAEARTTYVIEVRANVDKAARVFADFGPRLGSHRELGDGRFEIELDGGGDAVAALVEALVLRGARLTHVAPRESAIEAVYRRSAATEVA
ncbi:MAG TPA: hypothetical protein VF334_08690, partial [Polyangia bacterium]